jgi:hypothetical protein
VEEAIPPNMPPPLSKGVDLLMMVDSNHAGEKRTRCSHTGFIIFCNLAPIIWLSKQQANIETSVFGAEFIAMKHRIKTLRGPRHKICMMGIPLSGTAYIYGNNKSQVTNSSRPESTLKKKCNSICYHAICEMVVAMGETLLMHIRTGENLADFPTKTTSGTKCHRLVSGVIHDIYDDFQKQKAVKIIRLTHVTQMTLRGLKEYVRVERVSAKLGGRPFSPFSWSSHVTNYW